MNMSKPSFNMSTVGMQERGIHFMNANNAQKHEINREDLERALEMEKQKHLEYVDRVMQKDADCKVYENKTIVPVGNRVVLKPYEKNPYRVRLMESESGLLVGDFESASLFKNPDSGEVEESEKGIWCCEVIAVGADCKSVNVGDDVYINFMFAAPIPFGGKGYYSIGESNIICAIR